jgi:methionine-rich copper-binding protein CopC
MRNPLAILLVLASQPALAHAILLAAIPAPASHVPAGPLAVKLRYNSRVDTTRSKLTLTGPDHVVATLQPEPGATQDLLQATTAPLPPGAYTLRWQVLATDGHITRGTVPFTVDAP